MIFVTLYSVVSGEIVANLGLSDISEVHLHMQANGTASAPLSWIAGTHLARDQYVVGGKPVLRPTLSGFDHTRLADLPAGSVVTVSNEVGESLTITNLSEPLTLTDPGHYRFDVAPPFPFLPLTMEVDHA